MHVESEVTNNMRISKDKLQLAMARACMDRVSLCKAANIPLSSYGNISAGRGIRPVTAGKIARALGCDVEILLDEE